MKQMTIIVPILWKTKVMEINTALDKPVLLKTFFIIKVFTRKKENQTILLICFFINNFSMHV